MMHARVLLAGLLLTVLTAAGCTSNPSTAQPAEAPAPIAVQAVPVVEKPVTRRLRVTGTLAADEDADVAAETAGRVMATPVERGSRVREGDPLVVLSAAEAQAQAQEAEANVAQLEARLAIGASGGFSVDDVPEVKSAAASRDLAEAEFGRVRNLLEQRVVSQAEYDQRRTQAEAARNQYATARNAVTQLYRQLEASRARAVLARKALADTTVRAPFSGLVVERKVSVGDFVTRGTKVAAVVRVSPLRVEMTVPEQSSGAMQPGRVLRLTVDAYPGRTFTGTIRFVAPALRPDQRALVVEGIVANDDGVLKPGMFAAAEIEVPGGSPGLVVPSAAIQTVSGMSHVFVVRGDRVEMRMITPGTVAGTETEVTGGLVAGDVVALGDLAALTDGARITIAAAR